MHDASIQCLWLLLCPRIAEAPQPRRPLWLSMRPAPLLHPTNGARATRVSTHQKTCMHAFSRSNQTSSACCASGAVNCAYSCAHSDEQEKSHLNTRKREITLQVRHTMIWHHSRSESALVLALVRAIICVCLKPSELLVPPYRIKQTSRITTSSATSIT